MENLSDSNQPQPDQLTGLPEGGAPPPGFAELDDAERRYLRDLARRSIAGLFCGESALPLPPASPRLAQKRACFVTLVKAGALRGCIGTVLPQAPLFLAVTENARAAASRDPRFSPVRRDELEQLRIEISVLGHLERLSFNSPEELIAKLDQQHGVMLRREGYLATFLPQVWAQLPDKTEFLNRLAEKAGFAPTAWRSGDVSVWIYRVESFEDPSRSLPN